MTKETQNTIVTGTLKEVPRLFDFLATHPNTVFANYGTLNSSKQQEITKKRLLLHYEEAITKNPKVQFPEELEIIEISPGQRRPKHESPLVICGVGSEDSSSFYEDLINWNMAGQQVRKFFTQDSFLSKGREDMERTINYASFDLTAYILRRTLSAQTLNWPREDGCRFFSPITNERYVDEGSMCSDLGSNFETIRTKAIRKYFLR